MPINIAEREIKLLPFSFRNDGKKSRKTGPKYFSILDDKLVRIKRKINITFIIQIKCLP